MKLTSGPLLVVGLLVLLVGLTLVLTPAPPPAAPDAHDHEGESEAEKPPAPKKEPPGPTLADVKKLLADKDPRAHQKGMEELTKLAVTTRGPEQLKPIAEFLRTLTKDSRESVRAAAVQTLAGLEGEDYQMFVRLAQSDPSPDVQRIAILALSTFPAGGPIEQALRALTQNPDAGVRSVAIISLTQMLSKAGKAGNADLVKLLGQFDNDASAKAALSLAVQGPAALPVLTDTLYKSPSGPARHAAAMCIGLIGAGFNPNIDAFAKAAQVTHRQEAGHRASNPAALQPLTWALKNDPYAPTREIAAQGLGYQGDARAARPLAEALRDPDKYVRRRAAAALITTPAQSVVADLSAAATADADAGVRRFAVEALGWVGGPAVVAALNRATADASPVVRRYAAIELGRIADASSLQALAAMLDQTPDPDADVRWAAVVALGKLRDKQAEPVLVQALSDPSPQVSNAAERALQRLGIARTERAGFEG
jgi:HEAT repeat protein